MFAQLATLGINVDDYSSVKTVGDLKKFTPGEHAIPAGPASFQSPSSVNNINKLTAQSVGIDMESVSPTISTGISGKYRLILIVVLVLTVLNMLGMILHWFK